jgi:hypothetical protein
MLRNFTNSEIMVFKPQNYGYPRILSWAKFSSSKNFPDKKYLLLTCCDFRSLWRSKLRTH